MCVCMYVYLTFKLNEIKLKKILLLSDKQQNRTELGKRKASKKGKNLYMRNEFPSQYLHAHHNLICKKKKLLKKNGKNFKYSYGFYYSFFLCNFHHH